MVSALDNQKLTGSFSHTPAGLSARVGDKPTITATQPIPAGATRDRTPLGQGSPNLSIQLSLQIN